MPRPRRPRCRPTDDRQQLRLLVASPEQGAYELVRPILLFGQPPEERAQETGDSVATLRRKAARVATQGLLGLFPQTPSRVLSPRSAGAADRLTNFAEEPGCRGEACAP